MKRITNNAKRRLGLPGRYALVLGPGESKPISDGQLDDIALNKTTARWLDSGLLTVTDHEDEEGPPEPTPRKPKPNPAPDLPEGLTGEGFELEHVGGGWYQCYMNGIKVTTSNVRKAEAEEMAKDYETDDGADG